MSQPLRVDGLREYFLWRESSNGVLPKRPRGPYRWRQRAKLRFATKHLESNENWVKRQLHCSLGIFLNLVLIAGSDEHFFKNLLKRCRQSLYSSLLISDASLNEERPNSFRMSSVTRYNWATSFRLPLL